MSREYRLLVFDDDDLFREQVIKHFSNPLVKVLAANSLGAAKEICSATKPNVILLNPLLADDGFFSTTQGFDCAKVISVGLSARFHSSRHEVYAHFNKPVDIQELSEIVQKAFRDLEIEQDVYPINKLRLEPEDAIIGNCGNTEILPLINLAAAVTSPVLITGETGTGKNLLARSIHLRSSLHDSPFVGLNCAALPETLMEAELFGHERGAFTSAVASRRGILEMAHGGTLFLDEIGEIPLHLQSKLLNVLEEKTVRRLGSSLVKPLDFRIIASTSIVLENALGRSFRRDLYYRLNVLRIHLPPLRQRRDDIPELCRHFLKRMGVNGGVVIPDSEFTKLADYDWPGNVRELKNVLERAYIFQKGPVLRPSEIIMFQPDSLGWDGKTERRKLNRRRMNIDWNDQTQKMTLEDFEKSHIQRALGNWGGNLTRTAKSLGISLSTLKRKIKDYGLKCFLVSCPVADYFLEML